MANYFKIDRGLFDHPLFARDAYSRRDAWIWMIGAASYCERVIYISGKKHMLQRGQLSHSVRFMAEKWKWERGKVERFLSTLKTATMIETATATGQLIITICNYSLYQDDDFENATATATATATAARQQRDKEEDNKAIKQSNNPLPPSDRFDEFWAVYPRKEKKPAAQKAYLRAIERADEDAIIEAAERYADARRELPKDEQRYTKHPATWLNNDCWNDDIEDGKDSRWPKGWKSCGI